MSKLSELELVSTVDLSYVSAKPTYHFIYASELYGTLFTVYAKFDWKKITLDGKEAAEITMITLKIVNYKGTLNIGFTGNKLYCDDQPKEGVDTYNITFCVRGANAVVDKYFDFQEEEDEQKEQGAKDYSIPRIQIAKGQRFPLTFIRILFPLSDFEGYLQERTDRSARLLKNLETPVTPIFDTEFNDRDGVDFYDRDLKPGMFVPFEEAVGYRCNTSRVNLYYS